MKKTLLPAALIAAVSLCAQPAQPAPAAAPANPLSGGERAVYAIVSGFVVGAAEKMPEEKYAFKPTPEVRTFGQIVGHIADANNRFCAAASGEAAPAGGSVEKTKTTKADLVQALKDAVAHCQAAYGSMTDTKGAEMVKFFGRDVPRLTILSFNTAHTDEHYGNLVTYLRLQGIVPPSTERPPVAPPPSAPNK